MGTDFEEVSKAVAQCSFQKSGSEQVAVLSLL